jgi:hypothetical protein
VATDHIRPIACAVLAGRVFGIALFGVCMWWAERLNDEDLVRETESLVQR